MSLSYGERNAYVKYINANIVRPSSEADMNKKTQPQIELQFWSISLKASGERAVDAVEWPLTLCLLAVAVAITSAIAWKAGWLL
jgi:hypothetical protein